MGTKINQAYGVGGPLIPVMPCPILAERAPTSADTRYPQGQIWFDNTQSPPTEYVFDGDATWNAGGNADATTTSFGIVQLATLTELQNGNAPAGAYVPTSNDVATVIAGIVAGAVPPANETQAGIAEIATQAETDAGTLDDKIVSPLKLANFVASGTIPGSFTDLTATGAVSFTGATGSLTMTSATASSLGVTGAGIDLTLDSASGQLILTGGEAAVNAVRIQADDAAGGIDADAGTGGVTIDTTGAISIDSAATSNFTVTGAGADLNLGSVSGSVLVSATENAALAIRLHANGGTSETIQIHSDQGTGVGSIGLLSDVGGLTFRATGLASNDAINLEAAAGGIDMNAALQINIATSQSAADSIVIESTGGGIDILASGAAAGEDIDIIATGSSVNISATENDAGAITIGTNGGTSERITVTAAQGTNAASIGLTSTAGGITLTAGLATADAINIVTSNAGGGIDIDAGTAGFIVDTTGAISLDGAAASNFTVTGAGIDLTISSVSGSVPIVAGEAVANAIGLQAAAGGIDVDGALQVNIASSQAAAANSVRIVASAADGGMDIDAGTGGITIDTTGAMSLDSAATSNVTVTGAGADLNLLATGGSVLVEATENAALAIRLHANGGTSETIQIHADQGTGVASIGLLSDVGGLTLRATGLASADAINLEAAAGGVDVDAALQINVASSQAAATAIQLTASDAAGGITASVGTGNFNVAGNLALTTAGTKLIVEGGLATDFIGTSVLTLGTVTIANTNIAATDRIFLSRIDAAGSVTLGELTYSISAGASFTVTSLILGTPASTQTADVSTFAYFIVRQS